MPSLKGKEYKRFEDIKHIRDDGSEYWSARELAPVLEYAKWDNFHKVIKRAMIACENAGLDVDDIHNKKGLTINQKILDYMGSTELIANLFRISQTEEKLRKDNIQGADKATQNHYAVGREVRKAIEKIGGTMPEDLPTPEKSIQQIEKEQMERLQKKAKAGKLMLDE
ncbi:BRO family protein [Butyrivibrio sp. LC3010]|uniref:BRO family protein n=1 Tax=Butyrivibrio sp. LC3010 TaxID=1280680 RepID=UPI0003F95996|nr:BRO family protein [Butyrivibrio sp. LC3010]